MNEETEKLIKKISDVLNEEEYQKGNVTLALTGILIAIFGGWS